MSRFGFRAGSNAENPDFVIIQPDGRDTVRRLVVNPDGSVSETLQRLNLEEDDEA